MLYQCWRWNIWSDVIQRSRRCVCVCVDFLGGHKSGKTFVGFKTVNKTVVPDAFGKIAGQYWWTQGAMGFARRIWTIEIGMMDLMGERLFPSRSQMGSRQTCFITPTARGIGWKHACIHTCIHTYIHYHSFVRSFVRSFIHSFVPSFIHFFLHSFIHSFLPSFFHSYVHTWIHEYIHTISTMAIMSVNMCKPHALRHRPSDIKILCHADITNTLESVDSCVIDSFASL